MYSMACWQHYKPAFSSTNENVEGRMEVIAYGVIYLKINIIQMCLRCVLPSKNSFTYQVLCTIDVRYAIGEYSQRICFLFPR